jgi:hypothetical protein
VVATYGFKVFVAEAYPNRVHGNEPLNVSSSSNVRERILELLEQAHQLGTQEFLPRSSPSGEPARPAVTLTVGDPADLRDDFIHVSVEAGVVGRHTQATKRGEAPQDLTGRAAESAHAIAFLFPRRDDTKFVVITQTISKSEPIRRLLALLQNIDLQNRNTARDADKRERVQAREAGERVPRAPVRNRLAFEWWQATDTAYLQEILGHAKSVSAVFKSHKPSSRGGADVVARTLTIALREGDHVAAGGAVARGWESRQRSGQTAGSGDGVSELSDVLEEQSLTYDGEAEHYDSASLRVIAEDGTRAVVAVNTLRDVFTYPVSEGAPSHVYHYSTVLERLPSIAQEADVHLHPISNAEVREWLTD